MAGKSRGGRTPCPGPAALRKPDEFRTRFLKEVVREKPSIQCRLSFRSRPFRGGVGRSGTDRNAHCSAARCLRVSGEHQSRADFREQHHAGAACASDPVNVSEQLGSDDDLNLLCALSESEEARRGWIPGSVLRDAHMDEAECGGIPNRFDLLQVANPCTSRCTVLKRGG